jgi:hypothetical protein
MNPALLEEKRAVESYGGRLHFTGDAYLPIHSSQLLETLERTRS